MSSASNEPSLTAFAGFRRIGSGTRAEMIERLRAWPSEPLPVVFDDRTGERLDLDLRDDAEAAAPAPPPARAPRGVGRPKLGVVAREITLLPCHWEWLGSQPGGASVALRKLIDEARHEHAGRDAARAAREASYRFMRIMAGDLPAFEEAARALFAVQQARFDALLSAWPEDLRAHLRKLSAAAWGDTPGAS